VASLSTLEHPKTTPSTLASTLKSRKAEVWAIGLNAYVKLLLTHTLALHDSTCIHSVRDLEYTGYQNSGI
jgi:hypothetical protein